MTDVSKLILKCFLSPGDIVMLTAAVRDLHRAYPGRYMTDVRTSASQLWENNPFITPLDEKDPSARSIEMHYPLIQQSNSHPYHFIHGFAQYLEEQLGVRIPVTEFKGDIHLSEEEKGWMSQVEETGFRGPFWIVMAGGKFDFTAKWWNPQFYQKVVDHFAGRIQFVQCGEKDHWHPPLKNVINLVGQTDIRQFVRLMHHADGVLCPVTFAMHLAAAVETKAGRPKNRACVVVAGGREPTHWEAYPHHQYISTNGAFDCCEQGGCWKSRCQPVGDGDAKDRDLCVHPVPVAADLSIPQCLQMITPDDVIRRIEMYYEGGSLRYLNRKKEDGMQREDLEDLYEDHILRHAESPVHRGRLEDPTCRQMMRNPHCGDQIQLDLAIDPCGRIQKIAFEGKGCVISQASASILCEAIQGKHIDEIRILPDQRMLDLLKVPLSPTRQQCGLLAFGALKRMLDHSTACGAVREL